ncbi:hypothetical protein M5689_008949 [Euphorbia peplus]|nr:hypothetical protein M5689_008949 [Euphorbia peplus]
MFESSNSLLVLILCCIIFPFWVHGFDFPYLRFHFVKQVWLIDLWIFPKTVKVINMEAFMKNDIYYSISLIKMERL